MESRVLVESFEQDWGLNHFKRPAGFIWGISGAHVRRGRQTLLMPKPAACNLVAGDIGEIHERVCLAEEEARERDQDTA